MQSSQDSCRQRRCSQRSGGCRGPVRTAGWASTAQGRGTGAAAPGGEARGPLETAGIWAETGPRNGSDVGSQLCEGSAGSDHLAWHSLASSGSHRRPCLLLFISFVNSGGERSAESHARIHRRKTP